MRPLWRKASSSFANGNCIEVAAWRKAAACNHGECVEVGHGPQVVGVRDSKDPGGPALLFSPAAWGAFLHGTTG